MDEQIKPVAWIMPSAMKALSAEGSAMVGAADQGIDLPLYSQQSIDELRAEVAEAGMAYDLLVQMYEAELQAALTRAERAEAEADAGVWIRRSPARQSSPTRDVASLFTTTAEWAHNMLEIVDAARKGEE